MKRAILFGVFGIATLVLGLRIHAADEPSPDDTIFYNGFGQSPDLDMAYQGLALAPVPLDIDGLDPLLVGEGSYIVNSIGACSECHTNPTFADGHNPYMHQPMRVNTDNYLAGGKPYGPFLSRNLTPDAITGLPGGLTFDQFVEAMRHGTDFDCKAGDLPPCPIMQVMPWPGYKDFTDHDLQAIYAYLQAIPHAEPAPPSST
jgi:hypothetical protein